MGKKKKKKSKKENKGHGIESIHFIGDGLWVMEFEARKQKKEEESKEE